MEYARLGSTGLKVSRICLGYMGCRRRGALGSQMGARRRKQPAVHQAGAGAGHQFLRHGQRLFLGTSEEILGRALHDFAQTRRSRDRH